jgi:LL-diaminopimelate aminotransferase
VTGARRIAGASEYITAALGRRAAEARAAGRDVIALTIGDPDLPPDPRIRERLAEEVLRDDAARYPTNRGIPELREAVVRHYRSRFGVELDPERQVLPLLGAKEGIAHAALALLDPGDRAVVADPGYPVYRGGPMLAEAESVGLPLRRDRGYQPDLDSLADADLDRARLLLTGYPNNPTGALAEPGLFDRLATFAEERALTPIHDNAYADLVFDGPQAASALGSNGFLARGIEILSLSKTFAIPGWRIAIAVGAPDVIDLLYRLKTQIDAGMFPALQRTTAWLLGQSDLMGQHRDVYRARRDAACSALAAIGMPVAPPPAGMYLWVPVPTGEASETFADRLLDRANVLLTPGRAYGTTADDHVRIALTVPESRLLEAIDRIGDVLGDAP